MSMELWSTVASIGTFVVIGATAVAAVVQLRHMRTSNQIAAIMQLQNVAQSTAFQESRRFIRDDLELQLRDAEFRADLMRSPMGEGARPLLTLGNFYEQMGDSRSGPSLTRTWCATCGRLRF